MIYNIDYIQRVYDRIYRMEYNIYVHSCAVVGVYVYATHYVTRWHIRNSESVAWLNMWATDTFWSLEVGPMSELFYIVLSVSAFRLHVVI